MKKLCFVLLLVSLHSYGQKCKKAILYSSSAVKTGKFDEAEIKGIHHALWSDSIIVDTKKGKHIYEPGKIWGYRDEDCAVYRIYNGDFYQISQKDTIVVYSQTINPFRDFPYTFYFFSRDLDSPVEKLTKKNLEKEFGSNNCFMTEVNQKIKWFEDYSAVDRKNHIYKIVEISRDCVKK